MAAVWPVDCWCRYQPVASSSNRLCPCTGYARHTSSIYSDNFESNCILLNKPEQKLLLRAYRRSYTRNRLVPKWMTLPLFRDRIKVTSTIALHLTLNISETVRDSVTVGQLAAMDFSVRSTSRSTCRWGDLSAWLPSARYTIHVWQELYRVGQIKWHHFAFLLVTHEFIHTILWFLAHTNYIMQKMRWC